MLTSVINRRALLESRWAGLRTEVHGDSQAWLWSSFYSMACLQSLHKSLLCDEGCDGKAVARAVDLCRRDADSRNSLIHSRYRAREAVSSRTNRWLHDVWSLWQTLVHRAGSHGRNYVTFRQKILYSYDTCHSDEAVPYTSLTCSGSSV